MQIFRQRLDFAILISLALPGLAAASPNAGFELELPPGQKAAIAARPARDLVLASFVAEEEPPAAVQEAAAGPVRLALPAAGSWRIGVTAPGFLGAEASLPGLVGEQTRLPRLELRPAAAASLSLRTDGRPAAGLLVLARPLEAIFAAPWTAVTERTLSDAGGRARVPAGLACEVMVAGPAGPLWRGRLSLAPGAVHELSLGSPRAYELSLLGPDGLPAAGARVAVDGLLLREAASASGKVSFTAVAPPALRALAPGGAWASRPAEPPPALPPALPLALPSATASPDTRAATLQLKLELAPPQRLVLRVLDRESLRPVAGALLWPGAHPEILARSGESGEAALAVPWGGGGLVNAAAAAYRPLVAEAARAARLLLEPAPPGIALSGRVEDLEARPIAGARVAAREPRQRNLQETLSGPDGAFRFSDVAAGTEIELRADHADFQSATILTRVGEGEIRLTLEAASRVAGRVTLDGEGAGGVLVLLRSEGTTRGSAKTGDDGRFDLKGVKPGLLELQTVRRGLFSESLHFELAAGESVEDLEIELTAGAVVEGRVTDPDGQPLDRVIVELVGAAGDLRSLAAASRAYSGADGYYRIEGLPPGLLTLRARRIDLLTAEQQIEADPGGTPVDWRLAAGLEVAGLIVDHLRQPVAGARISAFDGENRAIGDQVKSDPAGRFQLLGVPPGPVRVVGEGPAQPTAEIEVTLAADAGAPMVELVCPPPATVQGRLLGASVEALPRARVWAISPADRQQDGLIASDGSYRIDHLHAGAWRVFASVPGFPREAAGRLELREGERGTLDLELSRDGYRLSGVVRRGGEPLAGVVVVAAGSLLGSGGGSRTDGGGSFAIESLPAGSYQVTLLGSGINQVRPLELQGDLDLAFDIEVAAPPNPAAAVLTPHPEENP